VVASVVSSPDEDGEVVGESVKVVLVVVVSMVVGASEVVVAEEDTPIGAAVGASSAVSSGSVVVVGAAAVGRRDGEGVGRRVVGMSVGAGVATTTTTAVGGR
jgi:hypothetical protein